MKMKSLLQFICCLYVSLLILDSCGEARQSPFISNKDSSVLHEKKSQHLEVSKSDSAAVFDVSHPMKNVEQKSITCESNGGGGGADAKKKKIVRNLTVEEEEKLSVLLGREMIEHIDYAGATTHPPSEPPKKKKTNSNQKSLKPPSRAH